MSVRKKKSLAYGLGMPLVSLAPEPIVSQRAPTVNDYAEIGTPWIYVPGNDAFILTSVVANVASWVNTGGGGGAFDTVTAVTTIEAGTTVTAGTGIVSTLGTLTLSAMAATGVITNTAAGVFESVALDDGEILIGATGAAPIAATLTAGAGIAIVEAANAVTITATGATAVQYTADDANTIVPDGVGNVNILGGTNIGSTAAIANTVTINVDDAPTFAGLVTGQLGLTVDGASVYLESASNAGNDIYLLADGGIAETIYIHSIQGTNSGVGAAIELDAEAGGVTIRAGIASANAILLHAEDIAGGIDMDVGSGGIYGTSTGGVIAFNAEGDSAFSVTGAFDLDFSSSAGSVVIDGGEAVADAIELTASNAAGGVTINTGTNGLTVNSTNGIIALSSGTAAINIGTDAAAHTVTVGTTNTTGRTVIQSGTGDVAITSTDDITVDATDAFSIDGTLTSNVTVTGASEDLQLYSVGGAVVIDGSEAVATAISLNASDGAGGVTIAAGTGGLLFGNQADCTTVDLGNFAPTANRTITVGGGTVITAATTDTIDIGPDGATTNANSIKTVNINTGGVTLGEVLTNVGTGAVTSGTHTVSIQSGNVTAGTVATNVATGTGTQTVNVGNADGLTTVNIDAITLINDSINVATSINTGTSTGAVAIGNAAGGAMSIDTAAGISLDAATASNFTVTGAADLTLQSTLGGVDITSGLAAADAITFDASDAAGGITVDSGTGGFILTTVNGEIRANAGTGTINIGTDAAANEVNLGTGGAVKTTVVGSGSGASSTKIDCGSAGLLLGTTANEHTVLIGSTTGGSVVTLRTGTGALTHTAGGIYDVNAVGAVTLDSSTGTISIGADDIDQNINIGTAGERVIAIGNAVGVTGVTIDAASADITLTSTDDIVLAATGDLSLDAATVDINATGGATSMTPATGTVAGTSQTIDARVFVATFTGQTTGAGADIDLDLTNSFASAGVGVFITVSNQGTNDADITIEGVNTQTAGHVIVHCINSGAAALNGSITVAGWIIN